jgi:hypothetical protein
VLEGLRGFSRKTVVTIGAAAVVLLFATVAGAGSSFSNGDFETGNFSGWNTFDSATSVPGEGWFVSNKRLTPINKFNWNGPAQKEFAAVTDQTAPGSHILYRNIQSGSKMTRVSMLVYYKNRANVFCNPGTLDDTVPCNQQFRVDILRKGAAPNSMAGGDILLTIFQTKGSSPSSLGPTQVSAQFVPGQTVMLRIAEVDNQNYFNASVDNVTVNDG